MPQTLPAPSRYLEYSGTPPSYSNFSPSHPPSCHQTHISVIGFSQQQLNLQCITITMGLCAGKSQKTYELSHHLIDKEIVADGTVYSIIVQNIIEDISKFEKEVMQHKLARYLANKFDQWFLEDDKEKKQINLNLDLEIFQKLKQDKIKKKQVGFMQLNDKTKLRQFMLKTEDVFIMSETMNKIVSELPSNMKEMKKFYQGNSIRKEQEEPRLSLHNEEEFIKILQALVGNYYLKVLRREGNTDDADLTQFLLEFHKNCGVPLTRFMSKNIMSSSELITILFELLNIFSKSPKTEKAQIPKIIRQHLQNINQEFKFRLIQEQYTYTVPKDQLLNLKYIANCYNSDLYRASLNEIENPQIEEEPETYIKNVNTFPVHTVKQSYKKI